jgi:hypothetical protein
LFAAGREPPIEMAKAAGWRVGGEGRAGADFGGFPGRGLSEIDHFRLVDEAVIDCEGLE